MSARKVEGVGSRLSRSWEDGRRETVRLLERTGLGSGTATQGSVSSTFNQEERSPNHKTTVAASPRQRCARPDVEASSCYPLQVGRQRTHVAFSRLPELACESLLLVVGIALETRTPHLVVVPSVDACRRWGVLSERWLALCTRHRIPRRSDCLWSRLSSLIVQPGGKHTWWTTL